MKWKPYPKYKESGIPFMGNIPNTWSISKTSYVFRSIGSGTTPKSDDPSYYDGNIPWVTTTELRETYISDTKAKLTQKALLDFSALKLYPSDTLLIAMYGATVGRLGILTIPATVNQACCAFSKPNKVLTRFFYYWLLHWKPILIMLSAGAGQPNISQEDLKSLRFPLPTLEEQCAIVTFLDNETSRIDNLISKKQRQIELLQEKRSVLISRAVTKGFDPSVKMKDSGVKWLGEIPEHWNIFRLKHLSLKIGSGKTPRGGNQVYCDNGIIFLRSQNIFDNGLRLEDVVYIDNDTDNEMANTRVIPNDILLNITGASIGRTCIVPLNFYPANVNQHVCIIRLKPKIEPAFISYSLKSKSVKDQIQSFQVGSSREGLSFEEVGNLILVTPEKILEQKDIVRFLNIETSKIDNLIDKIGLSISLLKEYRAALISAAVTGKIDIRGK